VSVAALSCASLGPRIVHVTPCVGIGGFGVGKVVRELSTAQSNLGMAVEVWSADADTNRPDGLGVGVGWTRFQTCGPSRLAWAPEMMRTAHAGARPALVHQHGIWTAVSATTRFLHGRCGVPSVIAPHGSLQGWTLQKSRLRKALALAAYEHSNLFNCSCLHALSKAELGDCRSFGLKNPVAIIPNGVSKQWLLSRGDGSTFRSVHHIDPDMRILLYVSRVTPKKGLPMLCQAIAELGDKMSGWRLVIVGSDEFGHVTELTQLLRQLGVRDSVYFAGPLYGADKRNAFDAADAFVLPSHSEGLPIAVLEAMGLGVPVVVTDATPIGEITQEQCGWRVPADCDSLAGALAELAQCTPASLRLKGSNGRRVVLERYTWPKIARMTLELYSWLNGDTGRPSFVTDD
jgi:glycosyltransferase involved in cell wall biosynthesis